MKAVRFSAHARGYSQRRGFTIAEVEDAIRTTRWQPATQGRLECRKDFAFRNTWNGKWYNTKQVRPIFVDDPGESVVVTVKPITSEGAPS